MRTYNETIAMVAEQCVDAYLAGSTDWRPVGTHVVAFAYEVPKMQVEQDLHDEFYRQLSVIHKASQCS
jgi:hypothetical protein